MGDQTLGLELQPPLVVSGTPQPGSFSGMASGSIVIGTATCNGIAPTAVRPCASCTLTGRPRLPHCEPGALAARNPNRLSFAPPSPCSPSSKNICALEPPIALRFTLTLMPVLAGLLAGPTRTLSVVDSPARMDVI